MATYSIETTKPVAYDSPDHIMPWGTRRDNSKKQRFNRKLYEIIPAPEVRLLDIGCSGGGLVKTILDDGGFAIGVEGSDYSKVHRRAEWATIPDHLFTADATVDFRLTADAPDGRKEPLLFNVITAWEVFEHIPEGSLSGLIENIKRHLAPGGFFLGSIATYEEVVNGARLHQTVHRRPWWIELFAGHGLAEARLLERYFHFDMLRGTPVIHSGNFTVALHRPGEAIPNAERIAALVNADRARAALRYVPWFFSGVDPARHLAWVAERTLESRLPGGRPFP